MQVDPRVIEEMHRAKERERRRRAALPFPEKIAILVSLQKRADEIIRSRGGQGRRVWNVPSSS